LRNVVLGYRIDYIALWLPVLHSWAKSSPIKRSWTYFNVHLCILMSIHMNPAAIIHKCFRFSSFLMPSDQSIGWLPAHEPGHLENGCQSFLCGVLSFLLSQGRLTWVTRHILCHIIVSRILQGISDHDAELLATRNSHDPGQRGISQREHGLLGRQQRAYPSWRPLQKTSCRVFHWRIVEIHS